jgi:uncharacterized membrane protein YbhN (UPF0104 family)
MVALTFEAFSLTESAADATAATLLVRFATLWFAVALGAVALWSLRRGRPGATGRA